MPRSPEQFYEQHRKDAERVEKAESAYDKHLEEARGAGDLTKHPELWDQASTEYQTEAKERIAEAVKSGNYDFAEELIRGLSVHIETNKAIAEREKRGGLEQEEWETLQHYKKNVEALINEISAPLTKKKMLRKSALLFDKTGSAEQYQQQMIECSLLALEIEKAANQAGVKFSIASFRNPKEMTVYKKLDEEMDTRGEVRVIKQLERRDGEGPTEEAEHLERVFAELSQQAEKDKQEYPKDIIYFTDGETNDPQKTRKVLEKIGQLVNVEVILAGRAGRETKRFYDNIKGVRVSVVPDVEKLPAAFGEILKSKYAPELLVGEGKEEISLSDTEKIASAKIEKMAEINPGDEVRRMVYEDYWQHAMDKVFGKRPRDGRDLAQLAEMRKFDPERFDKELEARGNPWPELTEIVKSEEGHPEYYLFALRDLKAFDPKLFEERFWGKMDNRRKEEIWKRIIGNVRQSKYYPREFLYFAAAVKDLDPERFQEIEKDIRDAWPRIVDFVKSRTPRERVCYTGLANDIGSDQKPGLTVNRREWEEYKGELDYLRRGYSFGAFFLAANRVSRLKVE